MRIGSTPITDIKVGSTQITKVIRNGITYWEVATPLIAPTSLTAEESDGGVLYSWVSNSLNEDGFEIWANIDSAGYTLLATVGAGVLSYNDNVSTSETSILVKVRAYKGLNYSSYSNIVDSSGSPYWTPQKDRSLFYTSRSGLDLLETGSGSNINAKIIPTCGKLQSTDYASLNIANWQAGDSSGYVEVRCYFDGSNNSHMLFSTSNTANPNIYFYVQILNKFPTIYVKSGIDFAHQVRGNTVLLTGWHTIRWTSNGSVYSLKVDENTDGVTVLLGSNQGKWLDANFLASTRDNVCIGVEIINFTLPTVASFNIDYVDYNNSHKWIVTGKGNRIYDVIGTNHLTWTGTDHLAYDVSSSTILMDSGFSVWIKAGQLNEIVPYKTGAVYNIGAYLTGYSKRSDHPGGVAIYNYAPSLVDFDYLDTADASLVAFDKSNSTHHIATVGMNYFDAANVYRWRQDELESPVIYSDTYKNVGYKGFWMIKGNVVSPNVIDMSELLLYTKDQIGSKEWGLAQYCTLQDIVVQSEGKPIYDGDNYLTWI